MREGFKDVAVIYVAVVQTNFLLTSQFNSDIGQFFSL